MFTASPSRRVEPMVSLFISFTSFIFTNNYLLLDYMYEMVTTTHRPTLKPLITPSRSLACPNSQVTSTAVAAATVTQHQQLQSAAATAAVGPRAAGDKRGLQTVATREG